jgi:hypothetical protein
MKGRNFAMSKIPTVLVGVNVFAFFNCKDLICWTKLFLKELPLWGWSPDGLPNFQRAIVEDKT